MLLCVLRFANDLRTRVFSFRSDGSDKRSCCKTTCARAYSSASIIIEQNGTHRYGRPLYFTKAKHLRAILHAMYFFLSFFFILFYAPYRTQIRAFFGDAGARVYVSLLDVPRCLPFYRDISKAFRISWTIREMFSRDHLQLVVHVFRATARCI